MSAVVFLLVCFLSCSVSEDPQIKEITAQPGDDVPLPCEAPNVTISAVQWIRSGLERLVYLKEGGRLNTANQDPSYVNRVQLKDDEMKNGELSLILKNVTNNDEGTYVCRYVETATQNELISTVYLNVTGGDPEDGKDSEDGQLEVILPVILIPALGVSGLVGFMIYKKLTGRSENNSDLPVNDPDVLQQLQENENSLK